MTRRRDDFDLILAHRGRKRKRAERIKRRRRAGVVAATIVLAIAAAVAAVGLGAGTALSASCDLNALRPVEIGQNSFVYASDGSLLGSIPAERNREPVTTRNMSPWLPKSTTAIEDRRFWEQVAVAASDRARGLEGPHCGQGPRGWLDDHAATRPQPLHRPGGDLPRKIKEACLAIKLARRWPKQKILNEYLNTVYYGNDAYGVEAASQTYFSRHASQLTLLQSRPARRVAAGSSVYDPFTIRRPRSTVATRCSGRCTTTRTSCSPGTGRAIRSTSLGSKPGSIYTRIKQPYFFSYVIDELERKYGANTVREGGLKVYTTIDPRLQRLANKAIRDVLPYKTDPAAAIVSVEPGTGAIRAMTAVVRTTGNQFNLVAQSARQAGSTFKTFVLASAIERGVDPDTTYYTSAPFTCSIGPWCQPPWEVHTYGNDYSGSESLTRATLQSDNTVYAQLTLDVGPATCGRWPTGSGCTCRPTSRSRRSVSVLWRSRRSTWLRPTRRSLRWGSTRSRWRSPR